MKPWPGRSADIGFTLLLAFLLLINFSIAACYFLFSVLVVWMMVDGWRRKAWPPLPRFYLFFVLYAFFTLVSTVFSVAPLASLRDNRELLILLLFPVYWFFLESEAKKRLALAAVLVSAFLSASLGVVLILRKGISLISLSDRLKGLTSHWMTYSGLLMLVFIYFSVRLLEAKGKQRTWWLIPVLTVILAAIIFSLTRSAWIGIGAAGFLYLLIFKPRFLLPAVPVLVALVLLLPVSVRQRVYSIVDLKEGSNRDRLHMAYTGWKIFLDRPLFGVGANNIPQVYERYRHPAANNVNPHLHNNFVQILAERGIFALISFLLALAFLLAELVAKIRRPGQAASRPVGQAADRAGTIAVLFTLVGFLVAGFFEYNFGDSEIKFLLFFFLSLPFLKTAGDKNGALEKS